jgi:maltose O-acetyltransferase
MAAWRYFSWSSYYIDILLFEENDIMKKGIAKAVRIVYEEFSAFHLRLAIVQMLVFLFPANVGSRFRVRLLRLIGFKIGNGTVMWGMPGFVGKGDIYGRLTIGDGCWFNVGCHFDVAAPISIGNTVAFGHEVLLLTNSHHIGATDQRAGPLVAKPIVVGNGAWLGARCTILPGVTIGEGAVVAAGAMVTKDVAANTMVAGVPAKAIRELDVYYVHNAA